MNASSSSSSNNSINDEGKKIRNIYEIYSKTKRMQNNILNILFRDFEQRKEHISTLI